MSTSNSLQQLVNPVEDGVPQILAGFTPAQILAALAHLGQAAPVISANQTGVVSEMTSNDLAGVNTAGVMQTGQPTKKSRKLNLPKVTLKAGHKHPPLKRALNSFIAYRSYYAVAFDSLQQKDISGLLTCLWHEDPFKAKWTLLAKAYSIIRDHLAFGDNRLDIFLVINAPFVGVIPPKEYIGVLGWELADGNNDQAMLIRRFVPEMSSFDHDIVRTDQTVQDIVQHSFEQGYIPPDVPGLTIRGAMPAMFNIMLSHPAPQQPIPAAEDSTQEVSVFDSFQSAMHVGTEQNPGSVHPNAGESAQVSTAEPTITHENPGTAHVNIEQGEAPQIAMPANGVGHRHNGLSDLEQKMLVMIKAEIRDGLEKEEAERKAHEATQKAAGSEFYRQFDSAGIAYPFHGHFHPDDSPDIHFDPYDGDSFLTYNISDFIEPEYLVD